MKFPKSVILKHIVIENKRCIGLHFHSIRAINAIMQELHFFNWNDEFSIYYIENNLGNLEDINKLIRTVNWINAKLFIIEQKNKEATTWRCLIKVKTLLILHPKYD